MLEPRTLMLKMFFVYCYGHRWWGRRTEVVLGHIDERGTTVECCIERVMLMMASDNAANDSKEKEQTRTFGARYVKGT